MKIFVVEIDRIMVVVIQGYIFCKILWWWGGGIKMVAGEKKLKLRVWGKKMKKKGKGEREKGEKGLKNGLKTHL